MTRITWERRPVWRCRRRARPGWSRTPQKIIGRYRCRGRRCCRAAPDAAEEVTSTEDASSSALSDWGWPKRCHRGASSTHVQHRRWVDYHVGSAQLAVRVMAADPPGRPGRPPGHRRTTRHAQTKSAWTPGMQRRLRLRAGGDGQMEFFDTRTPQSATEPGGRPAVRRKGILATRARPAVHWKQASRSRPVPTQPPRGTRRDLPAA